jgi:hypothetical protein
MESAVNSIMIQQMKFIKRIQSNEYLNEFLKESRSLKNNIGLIGRLINNNNWEPNINVKQLNARIDEKILELEMHTKDIHNSKVTKVTYFSLTQNNVLKLLTKPRFPRCSDVMMI